MQERELEECLHSLVWWWIEPLVCAASGSEIHVAKTSFWWPQPDATTFNPHATVPCMSSSLNSHGGPAVASVSFLLKMKTEKNERKRGLPREKRERDQEEKKWSLRTSPPHAFGHNLVYRCSRDEVRFSSSSIFFLPLPLYLLFFFFSLVTLFLPLSPFPTKSQK